MEVLTNRLRITELTMEMAEAIHADSLDDATRRFLPDEVFETIEEARKTVAFLMNRYDAQDGPLVYAVLRQEDDSLAGYVQIVPMVEDTYEIGYHIGERYRVLANCGFETVFEGTGCYQGKQREIVKGIWTANSR